MAVTLKLRRLLATRTVPLGGGEEGDLVTEGQMFVEVAPGTEVFRPSTAPWDPLGVGLSFSIFEGRLGGWEQWFTEEDSVPLRESPWAAELQAQTQEHLTALEADVQRLRRELKAQVQQRGDLRKQLAAYGPEPEPTPEQFLYRCTKCLNFEVWAVEPPIGCQCGASTQWFEEVEP